MKNQIFVSLISLVFVAMMSACKSKPAAPTAEKADAAAKNQKWSLQAVARTPREVILDSRKTNGSLWDTTLTNNGIKIYPNKQYEKDSFNDSHAQHFHGCGGANLH